jgi:hypothetical protein
MSAPKRVIPWRTLSVTQGNAIQVGGLLGAAALAWYAGRKGPRGTRWMVASRLLAYFSEHAFSHWLVGRALGIRFTGYGLHGTSHPQHYPPGMRWAFSRLPLLSARVDPASLRAAPPTARAAMYAAGTLGTVIPSIAIPGYALAALRPRARGFFVGCEPVERAAAPQRVAASGRGPAPGVRELRRTRPGLRLAPPAVFTARGPRG